MVINSLLSHAMDTYWDEFTLAIERLNVPEAVGRITSSYIIEDLTSSILDFQANVVRVVYRLKTTAADHEELEVQEVLNTIWRASKVDETPRGIRRSQSQSAHAHVSEWTPEARLRGPGTGGGSLVLGVMTSGRNSSPGGCLLLIVWYVISPLFPLGQDENATLTEAFHRSQVCTVDTGAEQPVAGEEMSDCKSIQRDC